MLEFFDAFGGFRHVVYCLGMHFVSSLLLGLLAGWLAYFSMWIISRRSLTGFGTLASFYFCSSTGALVGACLHWLIDFKLGDPF
jgi:uncharacterized membrane protein YeaQ/YmgE (transglycosylase-associated protein family)